MEGFRIIFQEVEDHRKSNATKHGLIEMLAVALPETLAVAIPQDQVCQFPTLDSSSVPYVLKSR